VRERAVNRPLLLLAAVVGLTCGGLATAGGFVDLAVYRFGGSMLPGAEERLYVEGAPGTGLPFTYPPFAALLFALLAAVPFALLVAAWSAASVLVLGGVLGRVLPSTYPPVVVAAVTAGALALEPVWATLAFGQVNVLLLGLLVADLLRPERRYAGVLTGIAAGIKLTPLLFLVFLLLVRRPVAAVRAGAAFVATVGLGFVVAPEASATFWGRVVWDAGRVGGVPYSGNQSVLAAMTRVLGAEPSAAVWFVVAGAVTLAVLLVAARAFRDGHRVLGVCLAGVAMLLASPISWNHHWVWAAPLAVALWPLSRAVASAWTAVFVSVCIFWPPHRDDRELLWTPVEHLAGNAYLLAALALTAYVGVRGLRPTEAGRAGSPSVPAGRSG
jgi:alpha-1,2-mannosyltransferase